MVMEKFDALTESEFASLIGALVADRERHPVLTELLHEDHSLYDQRGAATAVRMRGWILFTFSQIGLSDEALVFVLEELDTGVDPYLVAAAARALRAYPKPSSSFAPFLTRAIKNIRYRDDPVAFEEYGEFFSETDETSPLHELFLTLQWLGSDARGVLDQLVVLQTEKGGLSRSRLADLDQAIEAIRGSELNEESCCDLPPLLKDKFSWALPSRRSSVPIESIVFEDQDNELVTFGEFFHGRPSIAAFFYTRCDNPLKCSLTITKLARIQNLLAERGLSDQINTAAITYDPEFDSAERIRGYGQNRGLKTDQYNRVLRSRDGIDSLRKHFKLGVNFVESLVNRHRVEVYILDGRGRIARVFERIRWDEEEVVNQAADLLNESSVNKNSPGRRIATSSITGTVASVAFAFFPKCPICWAAYMSMFGIVGLDRIPYSPWLQPLLATVMLINLFSVWLRARAIGRMIAFYLASAGAILLITSKLVPGFEKAAFTGIGLTLAGSLLSALAPNRQRANEVSTVTH
jgi:protein SCO1/2